MGRVPERCSHGVDFDTECPYCDLEWELEMKGYAGAAIHRADEKIARLRMTIHKLEAKQTTGEGGE